ncbi:unnamed protein product, partial [Prorocentrum cordatum]
EFRSRRCRGGVFEGPFWLFSLTYWRIPLNGAYWERSSGESTCKRNGRASPWWSEVIPSCISKGESPLYDPIVAGEFLMLKHLASMGKADPDAHLKRRAAPGSQPDAKAAAPA